MLKKVLLTSFLTLSFSTAYGFEIYQFIPWSNIIEKNKKSDDVKVVLLSKGIKPVRVIYHRDFLTKDLQPDPEKIKKIAESTKTDKTPISFDVEVENSLSGKNLDVALEVARIYKREGGVAKLGFYGLLPINTHGYKRISTIKGKQEYEKLNNERKALLKYIDIVSPSLYNYDKKDFEAWKKTAEFAVSESKKLGNKKIYPYITPTFLNKTDSGFVIEEMTEEDMKKRLDFLNKLGVDGVIIWESNMTRLPSGGKPTVDLNQKWAKAVIEFN